METSFAYLNCLNDPSILDYTFIVQLLPCMNVGAIYWFRDQSKGHRNWAYRRISELPYHFSHYWLKPVCLLHSIGSGWAALTLHSFTHPLSNDSSIGDQNSWIHQSLPTMSETKLHLRCLIRVQSGCTYPDAASQPPIRFPKQSQQNCPAVATLWSLYFAPGTLQTKHNPTLPKLNH